MRLLTRRALLLLLTTAALSLTLGGCDSDDPGDGAGNVATVSFGSAGAGAVPEDSTVSIPVVLNNPQGREVSVEVLFAADASSATPDTLRLDEDYELREIGNGQAYVVDTITFGEDAEDGATQYVDIDVSGTDITGGSIAGEFALQRASSESPVRIGDTREFSLNLGPTPIDEARERDLDATVTVQGIVTRIEGGDNIFIQDDTGGIVVYAPEGDLFDAVSSGDLASGDIVRVTGSINEFNGLRQVSFVQEFTVVSRDNDLPEPTLLTVDELLDDAEQYEGTLVRIEGLTINSKGDAVFQAGGAEGNYTVTDGTGSITLRIPGGSFYGGEPVPSGTFAVTGVVGEFNAYQIFAIEEGDLDY